VGLIYADGNNVGAHVGSISTPAAYRQFATRLYRANEAAVFAALAQHLRPHFQVESADEDRPDRQQFWLDPFEILTIGGDDVMLFVPGAQALEIALTMSQVLEELLGHRLGAGEPALPAYAFQRFQPDTDPSSEDQSLELSYQTMISTSAGVVVARSATPVFYLVEQAEQLQKSAKGMRKQGRADMPPAEPRRSPVRLEDRLPADQRNQAWRQRCRGGTVDFLVLKSMDVMTSNVHDFRERALRHETRDNDKLRERLSLTGRPYTWPELAGLLRLTRSVARADLPRSQRHALHRSLFLGRLPAQVNYLYFFSRLTRAKYREALAQDFHRGWSTYDSGTPTPPWRRASAPGAVPAIWETVWHDLLEISDFVTMLNDAHKEEADAAVSR
jgi:CRISPR-associated protein Cmr2